MAGYATSNPLLDSFWAPLPQFKDPNSDRYSLASVSGTKTRQAKPPAAIVCRSAMPLLDLAKDALCHQDIRNTVSPNSNLSRIQSPILDLVSEQDVVFASSIYILTEVLAILSIFYPEKCVCRSEAANSRLSPNAGSVANVRFDLVLCALDQNGNAGDTIV